MLTKSQLRSEIKEKLVATNTSFYYASSLLLNIKPLIDSATNILIYHAKYPEINLSSIIKYISLSDKFIYHPVAYRDTRIMDVQLCDGACDDKIFYPSDIAKDKLANWADIDLIILPLLASDELGYRLGKGGGYYDNSLDFYNPSAIKCGVGFQYQLVKSVFPEAHDKKLDYFVSPEQLLKFK